MRGLPFNYQRKGTVLVLESQARGTGVEEKTGVFWSSSVQNRKKGVILEPRSVLDQRSPSPPTSTSTLSSPLGGGTARFTDTAGVAAVSGKPSFGGRGALFVRRCCWRKCRSRGKDSEPYFCFQRYWVLTELWFILCFRSRLFNVNWIWHNFHLTTFDML